MHHPAEGRCWNTERITISAVEVIHTEVGIGVNNVNGTDERAGYILRFDPSGFNEGQHQPLSDVPLTATVANLSRNRLVVSRRDSARSSFCSGGRSSHSAGDEKREGRGNDGGKLHD